MDFKFLTLLKSSFMLPPEKMILLFCELGKRLAAGRCLGFSLAFRDAISKSIQYNPWFTADSISYALNAIIENLKYKKLEYWISRYGNDLSKQGDGKVAVVMAGNIPLVGFHDFLSVLVSGNKFIGKCSSQDRFLLPAIAEELISLEPEMKSFIEFGADRLRGFDAVIATGSDSTSQYFEYYFGKYPHIIRKNRNSVALLFGNETDEQLSALADDIFLYFGLGCRNVTKLYVCDGYNFDPLINALKRYSNTLLNHTKYHNNYDYHKAILMINKIRYADTGFCLLKEDTSIASPISVLHYEYYKNTNAILENIKLYSEKIQCIVANEKYNGFTVNFGSCQKPELWDYADGVDTMEFLINFNNAN